MNLIPKVLRPKDKVADGPEVVAHRGIAMQIEASGSFEDPIDLKDPQRHHDEIGESMRSHVLISFEKLMKFIIPECVQITH